MRLLLIVEDEKSASYVSKGLGASGFVVDAVHDGEDGLHLALNGEYQLIILDERPPLHDGLPILERLHRAGREVSTIFLTAEDDLDRRIRLLDAGADACLAKPFAFSELLAVARSLLRRNLPKRHGVVLRVADLEIDPIAHRAIRDRRRLELTPKEFTLLYVLAQRSGEVLSRTQIAEQVWNMNYDCDTNVVDVHIRRLRAKVDDPFATKLIRTIRGVGYVLTERD